MDIHMISGSCAKVTLSAEECDEIGISYDGFAPGSITSRFFLASVLAKLDSMGAKIKNTEKLTAEIFENEDGGLIIYISGKGLSIQAAPDIRPMFFKTPDEVIKAVKRLDDDSERLLYRYNGGYALIDTGDESIISAKIKEHGKLISDAPKKYLSVL